MSAIVLTGDCLESMRAMEPASVDAVVTDPPYGLSDHKPAEVQACLLAWCRGEEYRPKGRGFMGRTWDAWVPGPEVWREALRVAKPGAHLVAFAGSRSFDLMNMAIRLAGWETRDICSWLYGSGFPKSHNLDGQWDGWGTALKPAWEPIVLARKPFKGSVAANVLEHGTGAINVDGCRIAASPEDVKAAAVPMPAGFGGVVAHGGGTGRSSERFDMSAGRWPANLILDGEAAAILDEEVGERRSAGPYPSTSMARDGVCSFAGAPGAPYDDTGGPSRFFYCAKASRSEREAGLDHLEGGITNDGRETSIDNPYQRGDTVRKNRHPTVKPIALMRWLCRLVTPPGGTILDPFTGSGSTGCAAKAEGFSFIGCELDPEHAETARYRIAHWSGEPIEVSGEADAPPPKPRPQMTIWEAMNEGGAA